MTQLNAVTTADTGRIHVRLEHARMGCKSKCKRGRLPALASCIALSVLSPLALAQQPGHLGSQPSGEFTLPYSVLSPPSFVIILVDDVGVDLIGAYGEHPSPAVTPNIDLLASDGVLFRNAYTAPVCSASRAMLMTGLPSRFTGIGLFNGQRTGIGVWLDLEFVTLPEMLGSAYDRGCYGKWHLMTVDYDGEYGAGHVLDSGFDYHKGVGWGVANGCEIDAEPQPRGAYDDYCIFEQGVANEGADEHITSYNTTNTTDNAIAFISDAISAARPFFAYVTYQAPHTPVHIPPEDLLSPATWAAVENLDVDDAGNNPALVRAMTEAADTEIGRLLESVSKFPQSENTFIIFMGDNGTTPAATTTPFVPAHGKASVYEGGINVPLIVKGPGVATGESEALVSSIDLFATIAELAQRSAESTPHSISLVPYLVNPFLPSLREYLWVECFEPNYDGTGAVPLDYHKYDQAVRNDRYKLIRRLDGSREELYDLLVDPFEADPHDPSTLPPGDLLDAYDDLLPELPRLPEGGRIRIP